MNRFNDVTLVKNLVKQIREFEQEVKIIEVCGTHTRAIVESGINQLLPDNIALISGPGCPICVTTQGYIDKAIELANRDEVIITTFADLIKVVGTNNSLKQSKALGGDIRVVSSPLEAVKVAQENPNQEVVFLAIGFETTAPIIALSIMEADRLKLDNYSLLLSLKTMPAVIEELILDKEVAIDGFICPGHVSVITGAKGFDFIANNYNLPAVVAGFERVDIIMALARLLQMIDNGISRVDNLYSRVVKAEGNLKAIAMMEDIFEVEDSTWRGLGRIQGSGLGLKKGYARFDAKNKFQIKLGYQEQDLICSCGDILKGKKSPLDCDLFAKGCTPLNPKGPCMVSEEGCCNVYYEYRR
jgi:hydrogenase expression/formation protein HypD